MKDPAKDLSRVSDILDILAKIPEEQIPSKTSTPIIAVSGGADSILILHLFYKLWLDKGIKKPVVFHLDHALRKESNKDLEFVHQQANLLGLRFYSKRRNIYSLSKKLSKGLEESGRLVRYRSLFRLARKFTPAYVVTGHHADDYLESILIHLIRGSGPKALATLPYWSQFDGDFIFRPLMQTSKDEINKLVKQYKLPFIEDFSNQSEQFLRNRLRKTVSPILKKEGLMPTKLWLNFHSENNFFMKKNNTFTRKPLANSHDRTLKLSSPDYLLLDRNFIITHLAQKAFWDYCFLVLSCPPANRAFLKELQNQMKNKNSFSLNYKCKNFYLWANTYGPISLFRHNASALAPFRQKLLEEKNDKSKEILLRYNNRQKIITLYPNESLKTFYDGMRCTIKSGTKKLSKVFQEAGIPLPVRRKIPIIFNEKTKLITCILFSFWDDRKDRKFTPK